MYSYFVPIPYLEHSYLQSAGVLFLALGSITVIKSQSAMGSSWRIGIDHGTSTELVTHGIFRFSRNPIYLGMRITTIAFFLLYPNAITLCILFLSFIVTGMQARIEENFLLRTQGENYKQYCSNVKRWI